MNTINVHRKAFRKFRNTLRVQKAAPILAKIRELNREIERIEKLK